MFSLLSLSSAIEEREEELREEEKGKLGICRMEILEAMGASFWTSMKNCVHILVI